MSPVETEVNQRPWEELARTVGTGNSETVKAYLDTLASTEQSLALDRLSDEERHAVLTTLVPEDAADLVALLPDVQAIELIEDLTPGEAAAIIDELPSNLKADLIGELEDDDAAAILNVMEPQAAADCLRLSEYEDDEAGGLMVTEMLKYPVTWTGAQVIADLGDNADLYRDYDVQYAYLVDDQERLIGVLRMRDLLLSKRGTPIIENMIANPLSVEDKSKIGELIDLFDRHHFFGVPVVTSTDGKLIGVVHRAAVEEARAEQHDSDFLKTQGIVGGEEIRSMPLIVRARRRLAWLSVNIVLNMLAASVIAVYQDTLSSVIALAVFLPIISDMSGCSGNQAVAVSLRELSMGLVRESEWMRVWLKEVSVGMINGLALGVLIAGVSFVWKGNVYLGLVVGLALCLNTMIAVSIGGLVPLVLKRFKVDPAIAAGPILTTVTDMCGFFLVLSIASSMLDKLQ
ncbi:Magnesium transporter MgtE [Rubripirellula lacrimiformis]|uniref:Magnesium transporter MgtE n=1 Tax=Rubripirellula lacrimiformis TaxID=1930273 RepID=A0A517NAX8_9BACT|nr:magnesium transporter [Rubripirellula lacrimiformis]QDT04168.1 Magnesium transporter MgtE [Rubripirellula lacrimiformis]